MVNKLLEKYNCILCKYNKYNKDDDSCFNHQEKDEYGYPVGKCKSLSNIYYGTLIEFFPFKQIYDLFVELNYRKEDKYNKKMEDKYGDYLLENDDFKFIWGVKSYDDLSGKNANLYTMNDIEIIYNKEKKKYCLGIETAYGFKTHETECNYLKDCLNLFMKHMENNGLDTNKQYNLNFFNNTFINNEADSIEELYMNFKIFVNGFCRQCNQC